MSEIGAGRFLSAGYDVPRRRRAVQSLDADRATPSAVQDAGRHVPDADASSGDPAKFAVNTSRQMPDAAEMGGQTIRDNRVGFASGGDGADALVATADVMPHAATIASLVELQKQRMFCIRSQSRCDRSAEAFVARYLGYRPDMPEAERAKIWKQVSAFRKKVERDGGHSKNGAHDCLAAEGGEGRDETADRDIVALSACIPIILNSAASRHSWDTHRANVEKQMRTLARSLPVWPWVESVGGFAELGLAIIVGEAGDLANYATKERLWKRLGLAVIEGERQQRRRDAEQAAAHGYNPRRRAEIWTIADSMFRHQWRGEKDGVPAHPLGRYGEIYGARKAHTGTREWTLAHREQDARRIMTKALIEELWKEWRAAGLRVIGDKLADSQSATKASGATA